MTQPRSGVVVLIIAALLVLVAVAGIGEGPNRPLVGKAESATALRDGRGVTAATATLYGALIAGTFTLLGVIVERLIQRHGKVRRHVEPIELRILATHEGEEIVRTLPIPDGILDEEI